MAVATAIVVALIAWLITHPESAHDDDAGQIVVGTR